jgi:hypothetical protein
MEYYGLILNRTFLILLTKHSIFGVIVNGIVTTKIHADPLTTFISYKHAVHGDLNNHLSYINEKYLSAIKDLDLSSEAFLEASRFNFSAYYSEISNVKFDSRKKWGMSGHPHDGKIYITIHGRKREFIILGDQSGQHISEWIKSRADLYKSY